MKKLLAVILALSLVLVALVGCAGGNAEGNAGSKKAALVINGPVADGGWNANAWKGLEMAKEKYGYEIAISENVKQSDYEAAFREYANDGYTIIFANGFEFGDAVMNVQAEYPDVKFAVINGGIKADNVQSLVFDNYAAGYLAGAFEGYMTKTNKVGFVGGQEIPSITDCLAGLKVGVAAVNPAAEVVSTMADSWDDMVKGKEIASSQITAANVDVLYSMASAVDTGVADGAKEKGAFMIGQPNDKLDSLPGTIIGSVLSSTPDLVMVAMEDLEKGEFKGELISGNIKNGVVSLGKFGPEVPQDIQDKLNKIVTDVKEGTLELTQK